jgi:antitoxin ParD1/3/4
MQVSISSEFQQFIEQQLALGTYATPNEVVGEALRLLQSHGRDAFVNDLRQKIAVGIDQLDRGDSVEANEVFEELRHRNSQFQAKSR